MQKTGVQFTLTIKALDGTKWILPYASMSFTEELNNDRTATFTIVSATGEEIAQQTGVSLEFVLSASYREVELHDQDGNLVYSGFIDEVEGNAGQSEQGNKVITSRGFFSLLEKRYTGALREFTATDAGEIAWTLIDETQAKLYGDFGITQGVIQASKDRDRTYKWRTIKEAIQALTSGEVKDGFDFDIDVNKVFNVFYPQKGLSRPELIFESGSNINNWKVRKTGILGMCNHVIVFGEGNGDDMAIAEEDAENSYKEAYFLLEEGLSDKDNGDTTLLSDKGIKYLDQYKYPRKIVSFDHYYSNPSVPTYNIGDTVRVRIPEENVDEMLRVTKRVIDMSGRVSLELE